MAPVPNCCIRNRMVMTPHARPTMSAARAREEGSAVRVRRHADPCGAETGHWQSDVGAHASAPRSAQARRSSGNFIAAAQEAGRGGARTRALLHAGDGHRQALHGRQHGHGGRQDAVAQDHAHAHHDERADDVLHVLVLRAAGTPPQVRRPRRKSVGSGQARATNAVHSYPTLTL